MTGIYVRARRDGQWQLLELNDLNDVELGEWISESRQRNPDSGWDWVITLVQFIRDNVR